MINEFVCLLSRELAVTLGLLSFEEVIEFLFGEAEVLVSSVSHLVMEETFGFKFTDRSTFIMIMFCENLLD